MMLQDGYGALGWTSDQAKDNRRSDAPGPPHHFIAMLAALSGSSSAKHRW